MAESQWFYDLVENSRIAFEQDPFHAKLRLVERFKGWDELISEDDDSLQKRPSATRSMRARTRTLLRAVLNALGPEVLLLCTHATTRTKFSKVRGQGLVPQLQKWWNHVAHPEALGGAITELEEAFPHSFARSRRNARPLSPEDQLHNAPTSPEANENFRRPKHLDCTSARLTLRNEFQATPKPS